MKNNSKLNLELPVTLGTGVKDLNHCYTLSATMLVHKLHMHVLVQALIGNIVLVAEQVGKDHILSSTIALPSSPLPNASDIFFQKMAMCCTKPSKLIYYFLRGVFFKTKIKSLILTKNVFFFQS